MNNSRLFIGFLFLLVLVLSFFKIHGTSIGIYNTFFYGQNYIDENLIFGKPRQVRGDEWIVASPLIIGQSKVDFSCINKNIGLGENICVSSNMVAITKHWKTVFQPLSWPFFLLPLEQAFAMQWWIRGFLLIVSAYLLISILTKHNYFLSITGSLLLFFSPFIQWWNFSTMEIIAYGFFLTYFFIKSFHYKTKRDLLLNSLFFVYFTLCYIFVIYPPFQVSVGLFILFFLGGYIINNIKLLNKSRLKISVIISCGALVLIGGALLAYYFEFKDLLHIMQQTSYPGKREITGGGLSWQRFSFGFYNIELLDEGRPLPPILENQSEASSFFMLFPFMLPIIIYSMLRNYLEKKKIDFIFLSLIIYLALSLAWIFIGLPKIIGKLLLLNLVPQKRMIIGVGVANFLLIIHFLSNFKIPKLRNYKTIAYVFAGCGFIFHFVLGYSLSIYPFYVINDMMILAVSSGAFFSILFLLLQKEKLFIILLLLYSVVTTYGINPLYRGLAPITNSELSMQIQKIEQQDREKHRWIVYDNFFLGNYLISNGANSLNSVHLYPQLEMWKKFDPQKKYYPIYNRYAHVVVAENEQNNISFKLLHEDFFAVLIHPCNSVLKEFNVKYFVFNKSVNYSCLSEIENINYPKFPIYIYKRIND